MANTPIQLYAPTALTGVTAELFPTGSDVLAESVAMTERANAEGLYEGVVTGALGGTHDVVVENAVGNVVANYYIALRDDLLLYYCTDNCYPLVDRDDGIGAVVCVLTIKDSLDAPIQDAEVWVSEDVGGTNVVAGVKETNVNGEVVFSLDPGTHYRWVQSNSFNFANPQPFTVV